MMGAVGQPDRFQRRHRFFFPFFLGKLSISLVNQGQHHIAQGAGAGQQIERLEDKSQLPIANRRQLTLFKSLTSSPLECIGRLSADPNSPKYSSTYFYPSQTAP